MIDNNDSVQLSEYCFGLCESLEAAIQGEDLDGRVRTLLGSLERCVCLPQPRLLRTKQLQGYMGYRGDSQEGGSHATHQLQQRQD